MPFAELALALLLAHVLGDFVFQRQRVIAGKASGSWTAYLEHITVHGLLSVLALVLFTDQLKLWSVWLLLAVILISHPLIDWAKTTLKSKTQRGLTLFLVDQALHVVIILVGAGWVSGLTVYGLIADALPLDHNIALITLGYIVVMFGLGWLNGFLLKPLADRYAEETRRDSDAGREGLSQAGMIIGWLERALILTAVLLQSPVGVGFVLAAKSVFRFENTKAGQQAAEYFIIGTLVSVTEAVLIGLLLLQLL